MIRLFFIIFTFTLMASTTKADTKSVTLLSKLSEAKDYLRVKPSLSAKILKQDLIHIDELSLDDQLTWLQYLLRSSIALNDSKQVEITARLMLVYPELEKKTDKFVSLLSSLGIFFRRSGYPQESIILFNCGLRQPIKNSSQKISLLISKGNSLSFLNKNLQAKENFAQALQLAEKNNSVVFISAIYNTLGIMAIKEGKYALAKEYLHYALQLSQDISRRSGQIVAGLQLLMISVINDEPMLYERLHYRISRLTLASDSESRHAYLFWIEKAHQVSNGKKISAQDKEALLTELEKIKLASISLHNLLVEKLAKPLGILSVSVINENVHYQGDLLNQLHQCK